ncbi:hypothetical protein BAE44_0002023, partial [Dichanthelium oligosanthes]
LVPNLKRQDNIPFSLDTEPSKQMMGFRWSQRRNSSFEMLQW